MGFLRRLSLWATAKNEKAIYILLKIRTTKMETIIYNEKT